MRISRRGLLGAGAATGILARRRVAAEPAARPMPSGRKPLVVVWSEGSAPKHVYPDDINGTIVEGLRKDLPKWEVFKASLGDPDQGLPEAVLDKAWVLVWWGHVKHGDVRDDLVDKIVRRVKEAGMGFISLHSSHFAKPNKALMNDACTWREYVCDVTRLKVRTKLPKHPIAAGLPPEFEFVHEERYTEPYKVPEPQEVVFEGDHVKKDGQLDHSRVGMCWQIGKGKFFYFQAGHESSPVFADPFVRRIMANAVNWCSPKRVM